MVNVVSCGSCNRFDKMDKMRKSVDSLLRDFFDSEDSELIVQIPNECSDPRGYIQSRLESRESGVKFDYIFGEEIPQRLMDRKIYNLFDYCS